MQDEHQQTDHQQSIADPQTSGPSNTSPNRPITRSPNGPSRDMFGGPWLGVIVFILIAVILGWGLTKLFQGMVSQTQQTMSADAFEHGFDATRAYMLKRDLVLGVRAGGDVALVPFKDDLPRSAPGRYAWPTAEDYAKDPMAFETSHGLIGIVASGTHVQFVEVIDDRDNAQTRILVMTRLLTGPYARNTPVLGMHLESADIDEQTGRPRYVPRSDLFQAIETKTSPVQSQPPEPSGEQL